MTPRRAAEWAVAIALDVAVAAWVWRRWFWDTRPLPYIEH